ncbi:hypothetical protein P856_554 [Candidatus Endolissoclinum faulkneri L5]|uniref:Uncharacterized protein n=2 Tax=Candidatus Endolissoclinum faulkneri TaxID=1263979 RepID=V9TVP4_9PROT|nr:hypothetical protein P856_554 [Candidatus Endolissoclinum faulkneri L5]
MIAIVTIIVLGPKELPYVMRSIGRCMRKIALMVREFQRIIEEPGLDGMQLDMRSVFEEIVSKNFDVPSEQRGFMHNSFKEMYKSVNAKLIFDSTSNEVDNGIYNPSRIFDIACDDSDKTLSSFREKTTLSLSSMLPEEDSVNTHRVDENKYFRSN